MAEIERMIKEYRAPHELAKAIEQEIIKARIEEYEYMRSEQFVYGGVTYSERIAELKKGLKDYPN